MACLEHVGLTILLLILSKMSILKIISTLNHKNLVKFFENFKYKRQECLVFEMLYRNLQYFIIVNPDRIPLHKIRAIAKQVWITVKSTKYFCTMLVNIALVQGRMGTAQRFDEANSCFIYFSEI